MPAKKSNEEAQQQVALAAIEINARVIPFKYTKASKTYVPLVCNICNYSWSTLFGNLVNQGKGCKSCAGTLPTPQAIAEERIALATKISGFKAQPFIQTTSKKTIIKLNCVNCGETKKASYDTIVSGKAGCARCSGVKRLSSSEATLILEEKLSKKHISFSKFEWTTAKKTRVQCKCNICEYSWPASYTNLVYNEGTGCPSCSGNLKISYARRCKNLQQCADIEELEFLERIPNTSLKETKPKTRCLKCQNVWRPSYPSLVYRKSGCPDCAGNATITQARAEEAVQKVCKKKNTKLLKPFKMQGGKHTRLNLWCNQCNHAWEPVYNKFICSGNACPKCNGNHSPSQTEAELEIKEICQEISAEWDGPVVYEGAQRTYVPLACSVCNFKWEPLYSNLKYHLSGCPACAATIPKSQKEAELEVGTALIKVNCSLTGSFKMAGVSSTYLPLVCNSCDYSYDVVYSSLVYRLSGCASCAGKLPLTQDQANKRVHDACETLGLKSFPFLYENQKTKVPLQCEKCNAEWSPAFNNLTGRGSGCPNCTVYGFKPDKPAILYYAVIQDGMEKNNNQKLYKIGITNLTFNERFAKDLKIISALKQWEFGVGATAREIEKKALSKFSSVRVRNLKILKSNGNTELFEQDILPELMDLVESY